MCTVITGKQSTERQVTRVVPQGPLLWQVIFLMFIIDDIGSNLSPEHVHRRRRHEKESD